MARIAGVDLPKNKRGEIGLTYIFGIGRSTAQYILKSAGIDFDKKVNQWNDEELNAIRNIITNEFNVERCIAFGSTDEYQAFAGYRLLPWVKAQEGPAGPRAAYAYEQPYKERQAEDGCRQEENSQEIVIERLLTVASAVVS